MIRVDPKLRPGLDELVCQLNSAKTKAKRKVLFNVIKSMVAVTGLAEMKSIIAVSAGWDSLGQPWIFIHQSDSQVITTLGSGDTGLPYG